MAQKRKNDGGGEQSARERKKLRTADARTIAVEETPTTAGQTNAVASSSTVPPKTTIQFDSVQGLPASIDVEKFAEARAYEINAMQRAIATAGQGSTHRAWQTLPRHLRRRSASHDVRRVPVRLRDKARAEMDSNKRRLLGRPKRGKAKQISRTDALLKRQRDKSWLETHIWHAKRAKMQNMWGYRLAVTPTEKAFRPSHRASVHGAILHDNSYYATIELKGPQLLLQTALEQCCDPQVYGMKRCMTGGRACETHVYKHGSYPFALLGPMTILWKPSFHEDHLDEPVSQSGKDNEIRKGKRKGKEKLKRRDQDASPESNNGSRAVWVRCHPAIFEDVFETLRASVSYALDQIKKKDPQVHAEIEIADLRGCINAFEIMGPKSSQVIKGALSRVGTDDRTDVKKFWDSLTDLQTPGSIPRGMAIGLKVLDPRLKFPPKNAKSHYPDVTKPSEQQSPYFIFPTALTAQSEIWDEEERGSLKKPRYKKKDLDDRRSKNLIPGTPLNPLRQDDRIPILLVQRSIEPPPVSQSSTTQSDHSQGIHGWTLLFPAGWAMAFLSSLLYTGTRFAGQRERMKQFFEAGVGGFPNDYPLVAAYDIVINDRVEREKARWERTPPAKKPNYEKLGTRSPWRPDWRVVLGLEKPSVTQVASSNGQGEEELVTTQRENSDAMWEDEKSSVVEPWLLRGPRVSAMLSNTFVTPAQFLGEINKLRLNNHMAPLAESLSAEDLMRSALVTVRMKMVRRGAPADMAIIYKMDDPEARKWIKVFQKSNQSRTSWNDAEDADACELGEVKTSQTDIIGYVTTGDMSLLRGEGFAIGAIPVKQYLTLRKQALRLSQPSVLVKIRNRDGTTCHAAYLDLLES